MSEVFLSEEVTDTVRGFNCQFRERLERNQAREKQMNLLKSIRTWMQISCVLLVGVVSLLCFQLADARRRDSVPDSGSKTTETPAPYAPLPDGGKNNVKPTLPPDNPMVQGPTTPPENPMKQQTTPLPGGARTTPPPPKAPGAASVPVVPNTNAPGAASVPVVPTPRCPQ